MPVLIGLGLLAGRSVAASGAVPVAASQLVIRPAVASPPFTGYRRYRGTVGGRPVVLELTVEANPSSSKKELRCAGSYFYERVAGGNLTLTAAEPYRAKQPLRLTEGPGGTWQATQPLGPVLTGTWTSPTGRRRPFELREDYHDAVRYEILTHKAKGDACPKENMLPAAWYPHARLTQQFLHLLGPDTLRPALRRLQCPPPAHRRALVRAAAHHVLDDCTDVEKSISIRLNAYGLLALDEGEYVNEYNGSRPHAEDNSRLYDLRAGRWLPLEEVLRPGAAGLPLLEQLVGRYLVKQEGPNGKSQGRQGVTWQEGDSTRVALPRSGVYFTSQGIELSYDPYENNGPDAFEISYIELLPLLRLGTPVARMLRERGLWPADRRTSSKR
jgi:hypothetical protein